MARHELVGFLVCLMFILAVSAKTDVSRWRSFTCDYFTDATYTCKATRPSLPGSVNGKWAGNEGFFAKSEIHKSQRPKKRVGTCRFDTGAGYSCEGVPSEGPNGGLGGASSIGPSFTGRPGGTLRAN